MAEKIPCSQANNLSKIASGAINKLVGEIARAQSREDTLEILVRRLLKAREAGMSLSDMQAMARNAGVEL